MKQPIPKFKANITAPGKMELPPMERDAMARWLRTFKVGAHLEVVIRKWNEKRSNLQNSYYWGTVIPILAEYFGHDNAEDLHEDLKLKFNPVESKIDPGKMIGGTTTKLSTVEFFSGETSYIERICRWAATEYSIYVPPPTKSEPGD